MNNTAFNTLCHIAQTVAQSQNIVLEMEINDDVIIARVVPIGYLMGDEEDEEDE